MHGLRDHIDIHFTKIKFSKITHYTHKIYGFNLTI
jgi:hypothetical protein